MVSGNVVADVAVTVITSYSIHYTKLYEGKYVLEVGVGTGRLARKVCGYCEKFVGIDISPKTIERAKYNLSEYKNTQLICADILNFESECRFDVIYFV